MSLRDDVERVLKRQAESLRELKLGLAGTLGMVPCPACGLLYAERDLAEHARSYADGAHAVVEVMIT